MTEESPAGESVPHILVLEDEPSHRDLILRSFADSPEPFRVSTTETLRAARQILERDPPDLIIADWSLPDGNGITLLPQGDPRTGIPLIVITGAGDETVAVESMKAGAADYLVKSAVMFHDIPRIVRHTLRERESLRQRIRAEADVQEADKRLTDILDFLPDAMFAIDTGGRVIAWNKAIEQMTGVSAADMLGKGDYEYSIPFYGTRRPILIDLVVTDDPEFMKTYQNVRREDGRLTSETFIPGMYGGKGASLWGTATPLFDRSGRRTGTVEVIRDITERKQTEDLLRDREGTLETLLNSPEDTIALIDRTGTILSINAAGARRFGRHAAEITGKNAYDLLPPAIAAGRRAAIERVFATGRSCVLDDERDGIIFHNEIFPVLSPGSTTVERVAVFARDITAQRQIEQSLEASERRFRHISGLMSDFAFSCSRREDRAFTIDWITGAFQRITGYSEEEILAMGCWRCMVDPADHAVFDGKIAGLAPGSTSKCELRIRSRDGALRWLICYAECISDPEDPALNRLFGGCQDITETKAAAAALQESEEKARILMNLPIFGSFIIDRDGIVLDANETILAGYHTTAEALTGTPVWNLFPPETARRRKEWVDEAVRTRALVRKEEYNGGKYYDVVIMPLMDSQNAVRRLAVVAFDITAQKEAQDLLAESEERYRLLLYGSGIGVGYWSTDGTLLFLNEISLKRLRGTEEDFIGKNLQELFGERAPLYLARMEKAAGSPVPMEYEDFVSLPSGDGWYFSVYSRITGPGGTVRGIQVLSMDITERKREEEIRRSYETRLDTAMEIGRLAWWEMDLPDGTVRFDERKATMLGYSPGIFRHYTDFTALLHPNDAEQVMNAMRAHLAGTEPRYHAEYRIRSASGDYQWFRDVGRITARHPDGSPASVMGIVIDITASIEADQALRQSEDRLALALEATSDGLWDWNLVTGFVYWSPRAYEMLGYAPDEFPVSYDVWKDLIHPEDRERTSEIVQEQLREGKRFLAEFRYRMKDGSWKWVLGRGRAVAWDGQGRVTRMVGTHVDLTEQKKAEQILRENEARLNTAMDIAGLVTWEYDPGTRTFTFNDRFFSLCETSAEREGGYRMTLSGYCQEFVYPGDCPLVEGAFERMTSIADPAFAGTIEHRITPRDESIRTIIVRYTLNRDPQGAVASVSGVSQDITDRIFMESEVRSLNAVLEQRVRDRTEALEREIAQRLAAEEKLQASYNEKVMLLKEIHHRVKNNLQIVISLLNLQSRSIRDPPTLAAIRESQNRIRAMAIVHEKLYRAEDIAHISLGEYVKFLSDELIRFYDAMPRGIRFALDIPGINITIDTAIPLGLVINELISNSLKYAFPEGRGGAISIRVRQEEQTITLVYQDDGIGIPADLDWRNPTTLGLRLVTSLIDQIDGTIDLDRSSGTLFTIVVRMKE